MYYFGNRATKGPYSKSKESINYYLVPNRYVELLTKALKPNKNLRLLTSTTTSKESKSIAKPEHSCLVGSKFIIRSI